MNELIKQIEAEQIRKDLPDFNVDTLKVYVKIKEGTRERVKCSWKEQ